MRAGVLSEDKVIDVVNEFCIPLAINVTTDGFPKSTIPALGYIETVYQTNWRFSFGFAGAAVIDNEGKFPLGHSAASSPQKASLDDYFGTNKFLLFLVESLERHKQVLAIRAKFKQGNWQGALIELQTFVAALIKSFQQQTQNLIQMQQQFNSLGLEKYVV